MADVLLRGGWTIDEVVDDVIEIAGVRIHRSGVTALAEDGLAITGSAAALHESPSTRAWYELLERASIIASEPAPPRTPERAPSRSNGVALAHDEDDARRRARLELAERDRVLRSWHGELRPETLVVPSDALPPMRTHVWRAARLPGHRLWSADVEVVAIVGFAHDSAQPLLRGFGAGADLRSALTHAIGECVQALAFLAADDIPREQPSPAPTPIFHLDHYLWPPSHATLHAWLDGRFGEREPTPCEDAVTTFTDITPCWARGRFHVARARCDAAHPLVFGPPLDPAVPPHPIA
jgi:hypothetical protein